MWVSPSPSHARKSGMNTEREKDREHCSSPFSRENNTSLPSLVLRERVRKHHLRLDRILPSSTSNTAHPIIPNNDARTSKRIKRPNRAPKPAERVRTAPNGGG